MTHPLARFASEVRQRRLAGLAVRPVTSLQISRGQAAGIKEGRYAVAVERWSIDGLVPVDKLFYLASEIETGRIVGSDDAEKLLIQIWTVLSTQSRMRSFRILRLQEMTSKMPKPLDIMTKLRPKSHWYRNTEIENASKWRRVFVIWNYPAVTCSRRIKSCDRLRCIAGSSTSS